MLHCSLDRPVDRFGLPEPRYSLYVERRLIRAYRYLAAGARRADAFILAHEQAFASLGRVMSVRQRMRVFYVLGSALIAGEAPESGIACLEQAMVDAEEVRDYLAWAELAYLAGSAERSVYRYDSAQVRFDTAFTLLDDRFQQDGPVVATLADDIALGSADCSYLQGDYRGASQRLNASRNRIANALDPAPLSATRLRLEALVLRWDDQPEEALVHAVQADGAYEQAVMPTARLSHGRLQTVITDIALDIVERLPTGSARDALLSFAAFLPGRAGNVARGFDDEIGVHLAALAQARWDRLADRNVATHDALWHVVNAAERIGDVALLAQARTAWGTELISRGWREAGLNQYRQTLADLRFTEVPAMGKWARDKLIEASRQGW